MTSMELKYLVKALRAYRHVEYGQFDEETASEVQETQDAARAIEELMQENCQLKYELRQCRDLLKELAAARSRLKSKLRDAHDKVDKIRLVGG